MMRGMQTVCAFFFFKQKTAYEMRISDWSSVVCASDLTLYGRHGRGCLSDLQRIGPRAQRSSHGMARFSDIRIISISYEQDIRPYQAPPPFCSEVGCRRPGWLADAAGGR